MPTPDKQLSAEQSRQIAATIREEIALRRVSRQTLAEQAKLSLSTLEKVLSGRRPFTLATTVRLEQALGVTLRKGLDLAPTAASLNGAIAPDGLGAYSRRAVTWLEGTYITVRPSFGDRNTIYAYRCRGEVLYTSRSGLVPANTKFLPVMALATAGSTNEELAIPHCGKPDPNGE